MFEAIYSNSQGETYEWDFQADNWQEAGLLAEAEEKAEWVLNSLTRLTW